jgi:hypothetical protein
MKSPFTLLALTALFFSFFSLTVFAGGPLPGDSTHPAKQNIRLQDGLLVYFPFNGNCKDASGHHNDGYLVDGGSLTYDEHGSPASAFGGNGYGGRVLVSNNGNMNFDSAFSVSFVGSLKRFGCQDFVSILENSTGMAFTFSLGTHIRGNNALVFDLADASSPCDNLPNNDHKATMISDFVPQPGCWYQITCSFNRGILKMYINGKLIEMKRTNLKAMHVCPNAQLIVGGWWEKDPSIALAGMLDEFRMYNRELSEAEVEELSKAFIGSTLPLHSDHRSSGGDTQLFEPPVIQSVSQEGIKDPG